MNYNTFTTSSCCQLHILYAHGVQAITVRLNLTHIVYLLVYYLLYWLIYWQMYWFLYWF